MSDDETVLRNDADDDVRHALSHLEQGAAFVDETALQDIGSRIRAHVSADKPERVSLQRLPSAAPASSSRGFPRALVTLVSSLVLLLMAIFVNRSQAEVVPSLGQLLTDLKSAKHVSMDVTRSGETVQIQLQAPGIVRWTDNEHQYRVADGHRLWKITDSESDQPTVDVHPSPIPPEGTDALKLLGLGSLNPSALLRVRPSGSAEFDGETCLTYATNLKIENEDAQLTAFAEEKTGRLVALRLTKKERIAPGHLLAEVRLRQEIVAADAFQIQRSLKDDGRLGTLADVHGMVFVRSFPGHRWTPASPSMPLFAGDQLRCESRGANAAVARLTNGSVLTLGPSAQLTLRPDGLLQIQNGDVQVKPIVVNKGDDAARQADMVIGPDNSKVEIRDTTILRASAAPPKMAKLDMTPPWLKTLGSNLTAEAMGSLVAQVDGKDHALAIGFHHVSVEIRDQIARTVIEESFVNNTGERLEGVFHFPLPHDASISGFGMWIGDQLIEAAIVEKQRAREIYETIKREKRDPGLLEWAGGNIFKARVFPIEPHSQKRIRITYTQTLPLQNGTFRYSYALRSEMLQQTPLRDLSIDVTLHSAARLGSVRSPSHPTASVETTASSASLTYSARDITPDRDFELLCSFDGHQSDVVAIPHIRGDDGYMMVQLSPPSVGGGNWSRTLVRDSTPLDVILVCDTSRSMDKVARQQQTELASAILGSLSEADKVRLAACDVSCEWLQSEPVGVTGDVRHRLVSLLESRRSLGWSNLQLTFEDILKRANAGTQVIYIGDGTVVNELSEASARCVAWLNGTAIQAGRPPKSATSKRRGVPTMHGIAVGNAFDMNVIRAIGRVGRGTSRTVAGSESPVAAARQLLFEITRPGLKDLKVEFRNVQVAAVYPKELPNLADGMQHILTGRFRPAKNNADAEIIVTGRRGDEEVRYVASMPLKADSGTSDQTRRDQNSFIPRLWAKAHLDSLLMEAATEDIQKRIIALSKTYHVITPFTSLLVLETDADRKRFGVERSFQMRDGEEFFAEGRKEAEYTLRQKQLAEAKLYRQQLYAQYRQQIQAMTSTAFPMQRPPIRTQGRGIRLGRGLGSDLFFGDSGINFADSWSSLGSRRYFNGSAHANVRRLNEQYQALPIVEGFNGGQARQWSVYVEPGLNWDVDGDMDGLADATFGANLGWQMGAGRGGLRSYTIRNEAAIRIPPADKYFDFDTPAYDEFNIGSSNLSLVIHQTQSLGEERDHLQHWGFDRYEPAYRLNTDGREGRSVWIDGRIHERGFSNFVTDGTAATTSFFELPSGIQKYTREASPATQSLYVRPVQLDIAGAIPTVEELYDRTPAFESEMIGVAGVPVYGKRAFGRRPFFGPAVSQVLKSVAVEPPSFGISNVLPKVIAPEPEFATWPESLPQFFPVAVHAGSAPQPRNEKEERNYPESDWPKNVTSLLRSLEQDFHDLTAGLVVRSKSASMHAVSGEITSETESRFEWAAEAGWIRETNTSLGPLLRWSVDGISGAYLPAFRTGRTATHPDFPKRAACGMSIPGLPAMMVEWTGSVTFSASLINSDEDTAAILLTNRSSPWQQRRITFDKSRRCVLKDETIRDGRVTQAISYEDHVQVESIWLPQRISRFDYEPILNRLAEVFRRTYSWKSRSAAELRTQIKHVTAITKNGSLIDGSLPGREQTAQAFATGNAGFQHKLVQIYDHIHHGRWNEALISLDSALADHDLQKAGHWLRWSILLASPEKEKLRQELPRMENDSLAEWDLWPSEAEVGEGRASVCRVAVLDRLNAFCEQLMAHDDQIGVVRTINTLLPELHASREKQYQYLEKLTGLLEKSERFNEANAVRRQIAQRWPHWLKARDQYLSQLKKIGSSAAIQKAHEELLNEDRSWATGEWNQLYVNYIVWLRGQGEFETALQWCNQWTKRCSFHSDAWEHTLRSTIELDRPDEVRRLRDQWLATVLADDVDAGIAMTPEVQAQFDAAFNFGFGQMAGLGLAGPEQEIRPQMLRVAEKFFTSDRNISLANRVLQDKRFAREPDGKALMKRILSATAKQLESISDTRLQTVFSWLERSGVSGCDEHNMLLAAMRNLLDDQVAVLPRQRLSTILFQWGTSFDEFTPKEQSQRWLEVIVKRWADAEKQSERDAWASFVTEYENKTFDEAHQLAWLRKHYNECRDVRKSSSAHALFTALLQRPWTQDIEEETWKLISVIAPDKKLELPDDHELTDEEVATLQRRRRLSLLMARVSLMRTWTSGVLKARTTVQQNADKKWDTRNRHQQNLLRSKFRVVALRAVVKSLNSKTAAATESETDSADPRLARMSAWLTIQRITLEKELTRSEVVAGVTDNEKHKLRRKILRDIRELLPKTPVTTPDPNDVDRNEVTRLSDALRLNARNWLFANWLQLSYELDEESESTEHKLVNDVLTYVRAGAAADTVAPRAWRAAEFGILVSLDQPELLEKKLRVWLQDDLPTAPWLRHLGHLLAELDRVGEAVRLYESAGRKNLLSARDWKLLSIWQHTLDRRDDMNDSLWQEWRHTSTSDKHSRLQNELNTWKNNMNGRTPTAPADVVRRLSELLESNSSDKESLLTAKRWYLSTHDPLVLKAIGSYVTGRSRARMLETVAYTQSLINDIDQEAGIDMLYESIEGASRRIITDDDRSKVQKQVDAIGLSFFEMQAAAHASKIKDQPGPHVNRTISAIKSITQTVWNHGERTAVAERLSNLGKLTDQNLKRARFDAAIGLLGINNEGTSDRLGVALRCAQIAKFDDQPDKAIEILESELQTYIANANSWSSEAGQTLEQLVRHYRVQKRFLKAERLLVDIADKIDVDHIKERLWKTRVAALEEGGRTLLGEGRELYAALRDSVWNNVVQPDRSSDFGPAWTKIQQVFDAGHKAKLPDVGADVRSLAKVVGRLIRRHSGRHVEIVERLFAYLKSTVGVRPSVDFLLERLASQPVALQWTQPRSAWNNFADNLYEATWPPPKKKEQPRRLHPAVKPIRTQVEKAMFDGFESGLAARDKSHHYYFDRKRILVYRQGNQRVLDAVDRAIKTNPKSESHLIYVVDFLQKQFENHTTAAKYLQTAFDRELLEYNNQVRLADLYSRLERYQECVDVLQKITETYSSVLDLRFKLMHAFSNLNKSDAVNNQVDYILQHIVDPKDGSLKQLFEVADQCRNCKLWKRGADLYDIAFERREWPAGPDPGLSAAWLSYAECLQNLNRTNDALDAVSAAWVICGSNNEYRNKSRQMVGEVLVATKNLTAASNHVATRAKESGEESSFLRRALGSAFLDADEPATAESHLQIALELQPGDRETRKLLVKAFDGQDKSDDAIATLIDWLESEPRNLPVYKDLHSRFAKLKRNDQAERAATSIVEVGMEEAAHHWSLAELREEQNALPSAIAHWQRAVSLRTDEPWALVRLIQAHLKAKDKLSARRSFAKLQAKEWDERFEELPKKMKGLQRQLR